MKVSNPEAYRKRRHLRIRKKVTGTAERPRMSVFVSNKHLYVQFIDDTAAVTLASAASLADGKNTEAAVALGRKAAEAAVAKGIKRVVFDRAGFKFGKRLKALADAAREAGLEF